MNATISSEVKLAIQEWFNPDGEVQSAFLSTIGSLLTSAVDLITDIIAKLGLSDQDGQSMRDLVRIMKS